MFFFLSGPALTPPPLSLLVVGPLVEELFCGFSKQIIKKHKIKFYGKGFLFCGNAPGCSFPTPQIIYQKFAGLTLQIFVVVYSPF